MEQDEKKVAADWLKVGGLMSPGPVRPRPWLAAPPPPLEDPTYDFKTSMGLLAKDAIARDQIAFRIRHVGDEPPRVMRISHDGTPESEWIRSVLVRFTFTNAWPWDVPSISIATGVLASGGSSLTPSCLVGIGIKVKHAARGDSIDLLQSFEVAHDRLGHADWIEHEFAKNLEQLYVHEFYEALLCGGRHVTEPHQPQLVGTVRL